MSRYSVSRRIARQIIKEEEHKATGRRIQREAAERPESKQVETPYGRVWMSPIESKLYDAMVAKGLSPAPQYRIEAYHVDFAFPEVKLAVEADGQAYHSGDHRDRDHKRDWILKKKYGWTVMRFHGTTIHSRPGNCAHVIKREVEERRARAAEEAASRPFNRLLSFLRGKSRKGP